MVQASLVQQGINRGLAATKSNKILQWLVDATGLQYQMKKIGTASGAKNTFFLKTPESISRKYLGPLVTVVARGITAGKNVRETVLKTVV